MPLSDVGVCRDCMDAVIALTFGLQGRFCPGTGSCACVRCRQPGPRQELSCSRCLQQVVPLGIHAHRPVWKEADTGLTCSLGRGTSRRGTEKGHVALVSRTSI